MLTFALNSVFHHVEYSRSTGDSRDFKMSYGEAEVRRQRVKVTSGDVITRVPLRPCFLLRESV